MVIDISLDLYLKPTKILTSRDASATPASKNSKDKLNIYTTRLDTIFGATFCAISPNHRISLDLYSTTSSALNFVNECNQYSTSEADSEKEETKGFDTVNLPLTKIDPVWKVR